MTIRAMSPVLYLYNSTLPNKLYEAQMSAESILKNFVSIMYEDLPYNHEQFTGSLFSEQYMLVQQITCIS